MEYKKHEEISYCTLIDLTLSQDELEVYECSMRFLLDNLDGEKIFEITGCTIEELSSFIQDIRNLFKEYVSDDTLPEKYFGIREESS